MSEAEGFGAITTLAGGGRYNGLVEELGGPSTPGIGFGMGLERLLMALKAENQDIPIDRSLDTYVVAVGNEAEKEAVCLVHQLRKQGIQADKDYQNRKMKGQLKAADRYQAKYVLILGENELKDRTIVIKEMATGNQETIALNSVIAVLKEKLLGGKEHE